MPSSIAGSDNFQSSVFDGWLNRTWQDFTASRVIATLYQNTEAYPIQVYIHTNSGGTAFNIEVSSDGISWVTVGRRTTSIASFNTFDVSPGHYYRMPGGTFTQWSELR